MWERLRDGQEDLHAAVALLRSLDVGPIFLLGHSSGGFYAVDYGAHDPDLAGLVLLSPLMRNRTAFATWFLSEAERDELVARARELVAVGRGHELLPLRSWYYAISAQSLLERATTDDEVWLRNLEAMQQPLLFCWGLAEARRDQWADAFARAGSSLRRSLAIEGCGHQYRGFEGQVAGAVAEFIHEVLAMRCGKTC